MMSALKWFAKKCRNQPLINFALVRSSYFCFSLIKQFPAPLIQHLPVIGTVRRRLPNGRMLTLISAGDDFVSHRVYWYGWDGYEPTTARLFYQLAQQVRVIIDVGAHVGFYSLVGALANATAQVVSLEPMPSIFKRLTAHVAINRLKNVTPIQCAASDAIGEERVYSSCALYESSSTLSSDFLRNRKDLVDSSSVTTRTLDDICEEQKLASVDLIKIDVEGYEERVIRGMRRLLSHRPRIICEILPNLSRREALRHSLLSLGYHFFRIGKNQLIDDPLLGGSEDDVNYLLTPYDHDRRLRIGDG